MHICLVRDYRNSEYSKSDTWSQRQATFDSHEFRDLKNTRQPQYVDHKKWCIHLEVQLFLGLFSHLIEWKTAAKAHRELGHQVCNDF